MQTKSKISIGLATLIIALGLGTTAFNRHEQAKIDQKTEISEQIIKARRKELANVPNKNRKKIVQSSGQSQSAIQIATENLVNRKAHAMFKLLCNVNPKMSERIWNSRNQNLLKYADKQSLENTHLEVDDLQAIKRDNRKSELLHLKTAFDVPEKNVVKGLAIVEVETQGAEPKPSRNTYVYNFTFNINQQKFVNIEWANTLKSEELG